MKYVFVIQKWDSNTGSYSIIGYVSTLELALLAYNIDNSIKYTITPLIDPKGYGEV
jgi:hypothetical protein